MGVSDFWLRAMLNHSVGSMITEKDRPILGYLQNIELELHEGEKGDGFDLIFIFAANSYFDGTEIKVEIIKNQGHCVRKDCQPIKWKEACNPTIKKQKKKKKGKKVTVEVKQESFFNFFEPIDPENMAKKGETDKDDEEEDMEDDDDMKLEQDVDTAEQIKDDLIPLALEYYLGVIENEDEDDEDHGDEDD
jgi:nucleosome assembly protein 1-like 1